MKKGKKILAAILAAAMTVTSAAPALASSEEIYPEAVFTDEIMFADAAWAEETETPSEPEKPVEPEYTPGWNVIDGKRYYLGKNNELLTGWQTISKAKYYFDPETKAATTGLKTIKGKKYYFAKNAKLYTSRLYQKIGSRYYSIDKNGVLKNLSTVERMAAQRVTRLGKNLKKAFDWSSRIRYKALKAPSAKKAPAYYGEYGFKNNRGDCYVQAYTFYWMAKSLGYNIKVVKGYVPQGLDANGKPNKFGSHAWCEIKSGSRTYVYDPNFETLYRGKGYKFRYGDKGHYRYFDSKKREIKKK